MRRLASADAGGDRRGHPVADLLQVHHVGAVEHGEVHDEPRGAVEIVQQGDRRAMQPVLVHRERSEFNEPHAQLVVAAAPAQPPELNQPFEHAMRRGPGQARAAHDLGQRQPSGAVEGVQHQ
jgi:hypothetical protein